MKVCFATVIYKQAQPYFDDLIKSIDNQTDKDFDLVIVNDNYSTDELINLGVLSEKGEVNQIPQSLKGDTVLVDLQSQSLSIAATRIELLKSVKSLGYDLVIIGDADDTFADNRVKELKRAAELDKGSVFFYNKLIKDNGEDVFKYLPDTITNADAIAQGNFLGMSTTAIRVDCLSDGFIDSLYEGECNVFDWYLYSRILLDVGKGIYVPNTSTIYRIYDNNEVGTTRDLSKEKIVKLTHYANLAKRYPEFKKLYDELEKIDVTKLGMSDQHQGYWWSDIKLENIV